MSRDSLSSQKLSMNWCFLDCKSRQNHVCRSTRVLTRFCLLFSGTTADRFYRIDRAQVRPEPCRSRPSARSDQKPQNCPRTTRLCLCPQEHLNYVSEISQDDLYILDPELVVKETVGTSPSMPDLVDSEDPPRQFSYPCSPSSPICSSAAR